MMSPTDDEACAACPGRHVAGRTAASAATVGSRAPAPRRTLPSPPGGCQSPGGAGRGRGAHRGLLHRPALAPRAPSNTPAATPSVPSGWVAHSAYGLQLAAPRTWSVQVFGQCPDGSRPGTLFIGTPPYAVFCPEYGSTTTQVTMYRSEDRPPPTGRLQGSAHILRVHGLSVTSSRTDAGLLWTIPSMHVTITGSGPNALPIMQSLAPATRRASPAIGKVTGSEYLEALVRHRSPGPVRVRPPSGTPFEVEAVDGQFSFTGPPGTYVLTGHDGNVSCPPVSVTVHSGESATALPIQCNGD